MNLQHKIDFAIIFSVRNANPNGDPLNGNRPRINYDGYGEITDVCLKRKIRDRLQDAGDSIFVQSDEKKTDGMTSLQNRAYTVLGKDTFIAKKTPIEDAIKKCCKEWFDVRTFGQVFAYGGGDSVSIPIRGPVSIQSAFSLEPVSVTSTQITKSVSGEGDGTKKASDTMGMKHRVDQAIYVTYGSMNPQLADRTGFTNEDAETIKKILPKLFENDASSARPEGSMDIKKVIWWKHKSKSAQYSSAKIHYSLRNIIEPDGSFAELDLKKALSGLEPEIIDGF